MTIKIEYGHRPIGLDNIGYGRATYRGTKQHLVAFEAYNTSAFCGKTTVSTPVSYASGTVCAVCAQLLGIASVNSFELDKDEAWLMGVST